MNDKRLETWTEKNRRYLMTEVAEVSELLEKYLEDSRPEQRALKKKKRKKTKISKATKDTFTDLSEPPALETLTRIFGLSSFERNLVTLCAGIELDANLASLSAIAQGDQNKHYVTYSLALAALCGSRVFSLRVSLHAPDSHREIDHCISVILLERQTILCFASGYDAPPTSKHHGMHILAEGNVVLWVNYHASRAPSASCSDLPESAISKRMRV